jgi:hypothetical protein
VPSLCLCSAPQSGVQPNIGDETLRHLTDWRCLLPCSRTAFSNVECAAHKSICPDGVVHWWMWEAQCPTVPSAEAPLHSDSAQSPPCSARDLYPDAPGRYYAANQRNMTDTEERQSLGMLAGSLWVQTGLFESPLCSCCCCDICWILHPGMKSQLWATTTTDDVDRVELGGEFRAQFVLLMSTRRSSLLPGCSHLVCCSLPCWRLHW